MPRSWSAKVLAGTLLVACAVPGAAQAPAYRLTYRIEIVRVTPQGRLTLAKGEVSGPLDTGLRLSLRDETVEVEAFLDLLTETDSVTLTADFFTKRRLGTSRRGLALWEQDGYTRFTRLAWGDTARVYPLGLPAARRRDSLWADISIEREPSGGETRPGETLYLGSQPGMAITVEAVVRPRRAVVILNLVRGEAVTGPRRYDLVPEGAGRRVEFVLGAGTRRTMDLSLTRPELARSARDRALGMDAGVVCLRVTEPGASDPAGVLCGRLDNIARRLPLAGGDTLVATFAWPGYR